MDDKTFELLEKSVIEGGKILQGKITPSRKFVYEIPSEDMPPERIKAIRGKFNLSQNEFAHLIHISSSTLANWEQGRRIPEGPARVLLLIAENNPETILGMQRMDKMHPA
jgi:putative transcriptional regulator